jgi:hypothetical protein
MTMKNIKSTHQKISSAKQTNTFVVEQLPVSQGAPAACFSQVILLQVLTSKHYGCCTYAISRKIKLNFNSFSHLLTQETILRKVMDQDFKNFDQILKSQSRV